MVTDAVSVRARTSSIPYVGRLLLTLFLLALYVFGQRIPLPGVDVEALLSLQIGRNLWSVVSLGFMPFVTGFLLVELFSLATPPGRRLRQLGRPGRAKLNRAALSLSLLVAGIQATGIALWMERMSSPWGAPIVGDPGLGFRLITILTLTAATAALFVLCQLISTYGIGNGFALLILLQIVMGILSAGARGGLAAFDPSSVQGLVLLLIVGLAVVVVRFFRTAEDAWLPAFPQGVVPVQLALYFSVVLWPAAAALSLIPLETPVAKPLLALILIPLLSWGTFHLFSSRPRLRANLTDPDELLDEIAAALRRRAVIATVLLTLGTAAFLAWQGYRPNVLAFTLRFVDIVILAAIGLDVWDQFRFQRGHGETALLTQLDNVHFSYRLEELLQEKGIATLARGHQLRSLFFFLGSLYKIDVLVPVTDLERAREVLAELETAREIRAF
ncbi:MAG: putative signal transducing protein [Thermoanaerobaculia bacterium]